MPPTPAGTESNPTGNMLQMLGMFAILSAIFLFFRKRNRKFSQIKREDMVALVHETCAPGEQVCADCRAFIEGNQSATLAVVTNKHFHLFSFDRDWKKKKLRVVAHTAAPLHKVSMVSESEEKGKLDGFLRLNFWCEGAKQNFLMSNDAKAREVILQLRGKASSLADVRPQSGVADELKKLAELANEGILSDDEWTRAKELFLGRRVDKREQAVKTLRQLHDLQTQGVLSQSEFNSKKWDVLAGKDLG